MTGASSSEKVATLDNPVGAIKNGLSHPSSGRSLGRHPASTVKYFLTLWAIIFLLVPSGLAGSLAKNYTPEQIAVESRRANEFLDKSFDKFVSQHPQLESQLGIKTHYDQWDDVSDAQAVADLAAEMENLAALKRDFDFAALDPQAQISYQLFEQQAQRDAEGFRFRFDTYPVNQMYGAQSQIPTFLINIHRIDTVQDAEAYIARINKIPTVLDQVIVNLQARAENRNHCAEIRFSARA